MTENTRQPLRSDLVLPNQRNSGVVRNMLLITIAIYVMTIFTADPRRLEIAYVEFIFQLLSWAIVTTVAIQRLPNRSIRISDYLVFMSFWELLYFILPSIAWLQGNPSQWSKFIDINDQIASRVFIAHGLFMLAFSVGFISLKPATNYSNTIDNSERIPPGWPLFLFSIIISLIIQITIRYYVTGSLAKSSYGDWSRGFVDLTMNLQGGRGGSYFLFQLYAQFYFMITLLMGAGIGLILARSINNRLDAIRNVLLLGFFLLLFYLLGSGARDEIIVPILIGLVFVDMVVYKIPIRWYMIVFMFVGLVLLDFLATYRQYSDDPISVALPMAIEKYTEPGTTRFSEFSLMLDKEMVSAQIFGEYHQNTSQYLTNMALGWVPSQIFPDKISYVRTDEILARYVFGDKNYLNSGLAGTMIGEGFRLAKDRLLGVLFLAFLVGLMIGGVDSILLGSDITHKTILHVLLHAGLVSTSYRIIRSSPSDIISNVFYDILIPSIVFTVLMLRRPTFWNTPIHWLTGVSNQIRSGRL